MKQELIERFRNHGIDIQAHDPVSRIPSQLRETDPETLWLVLEDFSNGQPIGMDSPNEKMHQLTLSYTLVDALENDRESITQDDVDRAFQKAADMAESMVKGSSTKADDEPADNAPVASQSRKARKKKDPDLAPFIRRTVEENPDATTDELIEMIQAVKTGPAVSTIRVYISKARNGKL